MNCKIFKLSISILFLLIFASCDHIEKPYIQENSDKCGNGDLSVPIKKILLEDYTGHTCGNCPRAAEQTEYLIETYCDHIIPVSVHAGYFAKPYSSGKYTYDFRTQTGNDWDNYFGNSSAGLPNGMLNRTEYGGSVIQSYENWPSVVEYLLTDPPTIDISIDNSYNDANRELKTNIKIAFLEKPETGLMLNVIFVEDSIVNWQKDYQYEDPVNPGNTDIENYIHRHVLRDAINGSWGESLQTVNMDKGSILEKNYTYVVDSEYKAKNCSVIAFVYYNKTKEIIQAEENTIK